MRIAGLASLCRLRRPRTLLGKTQASCNLTLQIRDGQIQNTLSRMEHNIQRAFTTRRGKPHGLSHASLNAVAFDGTAQDFPNCETHAWAGLRSVFAPAQQVKHRHIAGELPPAVLIHPLEVRMFQQALRLREPAAGGGHVCRHLSLIGRHGTARSGQLPTYNFRTCCDRVERSALRGLVPEARFHRDALAPLGTTARKHRPAALGLHARTKAVRL